MHPTLLDKLRDRDYIIYRGPDTDEFLKHMHAHASTSMSVDEHGIMRNISLKSQGTPRQVEVVEEWLHNVQQRIGLIDWMTRDQFEYHVKTFMADHSRLLGLTQGDVRWLRASREMYNPPMLGLPKGDPRWLRATKAMYKP